MDKLDQKRRLNFLNKVREDSNLSGKMLEYKNQDFESFMDKLRKVDERVRELVVSETGKDDLKDYIKVARSNFNRREYVNTVITLGRFHEILAKIAAEFKSLEIDQGKIHNKFLFDGLDESQKEFLMKKMPETFKKKPVTVKASIVTDSFIKEAGISDMWHNLTSDRGRALKAWEKRFPKFAKVFKRETEKMLNKSDGLYHALTGTLKSIGILRAHRKAEEYLAVAGGFVKKFDAFHNEFGAYYDQYVNQLIETQKSIDAELPKATPEATPVAMDEPGLKDFMATPGAPATPAAAVSSPLAAIVPPPSPSPTTAPSPAPVAPSGGAGTARHFAPPGSTAPNSAQMKAMQKMQDLVDQNEAARTSKSVKADDDQVISGLKGVIESKKDDAPPATQKSPGKTANVKHKQIIHEYIPDTLRDGDPAFETFEDEESPETLSYNFPEDDFIPKAPKLPLEFEEMVNKDQQDYESTLRLMEQREMQRAEQEMSTVAPRKNAEQFLIELNSFAGENSLVFAAKIVKFANSIAKSDKETSDKLLSIAKNLLSKI